MKCYVLNICGGGTFNLTDNEQMRRLCGTGLFDFGLCVHLFAHMLHKLIDV